MPSHDGSPLARCLLFWQVASTRFLSCSPNAARYDEAEPLYQQSLAQSTSVLGPTHPDTLSTMHNLALLLADRGEMSQAESLHRRALAGRVAELGASHPHTFVSMDHLAIVLADQVPCPSSPTSRSPPPLESPVCSSHSAPHARSSG